MIRNGGDMHTIKIPFYLGRKGLVGIFIDRLVDGDNLIYCTYKRKRDGIMPYTRGVVINKEEAIHKYGLSQIQKNSDRLGIFLPISLFTEEDEMV